jgi:cell surface protein SprA
LKDGDSRAIFKNVDLDSRMYNNIKMNVHAEQLNNQPLKDGDLTLFFRVGTDYNNNYYEYEVPLKLTPKGVYQNTNTDDRAAVWPGSNEVNFNFNDISATKDERNRRIGFYTLDSLSKPYSKTYSGYTVTVVGNPNLGTIKSVMVGIRNPKGGNLAHCAEVWINELRLTDFNNAGGWATTGQLQAKLADLGMVSLAGTYSTPFWGSVESKIGARSKETSRNWDVSSSINAGKFFPDKWRVTLPVFYNYGITRITPLFNPLDPDVRMTDVDNNQAISDGLKKNIARQVEDYTQRKGFNLSNVRIDGFKRKGAKPMPWDVSNFSVTYAYTQIYKRSVNIDSSINKQYRANVQYAYTFQNPFTIKPFTKVKFLQNKWFALIKDFNLQLMPNSFGVSMDGSRTFSLLKNRDITSFYTSSNAANNDLLNPTLYNKNFVLGRSYNFRWDLNKALKFDYAATNDSRVIEPFGDVSKNSQPQRDSVIQNLKSGGLTTTFRQQMNLNATIPLNKIPIFDFTTLTYRYSGTYTWNRMPFAIPDTDTTRIGNTIQNTNGHNVSANLNMVMLYNKIPYFKKLNSPPPPKKPITIGKKGDPKMVAKKGDAPAEDTTKKVNNFKEIGEFLARGIMMLKSVAVTFQQQGGQGMPNFRPSSRRGGMDPAAGMAPGFLFTTGLADKDIREKSLRNDWLVRTQNQTTPYTEIKTTNYSYQAQVEPHGSFKVQLNGNYNKSLNRTEYILYDRDTERFILNSTPNVSGNFDISTFTFFRSFQDGNDQMNSKLFRDFLDERGNVARELGDANNNNAPGYLQDSKGTPYVDGYTTNQQDVLMHAFYRTYTGRSIKNYNTENIFPGIPLPNWTISWDGLGKLNIFKKTFRNITVRHGYKSNYRLSNFNNNILFNADGKTQDIRVPVTSGTGANANFASYYNVNAITISESFSPLIKFDLQFVKQGWSANAETRRDKTTTLNVTAFQIIETKGQEYIVGLGYMYPKLKFKNIKIQGKTLESNLLVKLDLSYRRNLSVIRDVALGTSIPTGGTDIITLRSSADYQLTPNINLRVFYDWIRTKPKTSASFPTASGTGGFSIRINFQ